VKEAYHICGVQETNQKLRNETGIMRKKFTSLQKEIDDHKEEIRKYQAEISKLNSVIRNLEKDIVGLKKEIQERDETIQDKVCFSIAYYYYCCCCCRCCDVVYFYYRFNSHFINLPYFFVWVTEVHWLLTLHLKYGLLRRWYLQACGRLSHMIRTRTLCVVERKICNWWKV